MGTSPRSIQSLLHTATPDIADLLGYVRFLGRIREALLEVLPAQAAPCIQVGAYDNYRLRLHVDNASWATRLRYMKPVIAQALAQRMQLHIESVDIKVRSVRMEATPVPRARPMSDASRTHIRRTATYIDDSALADALNRLAVAGRTPRGTSSEIP